MENLKFVKHPKIEDTSSIWHLFLKEKNGGYAKCIKCNEILKTGGGSTSALLTLGKTIHQYSTSKRVSTS